MNTKHTEIEVVGKWCKCQQSGAWMQLSDIRVLRIDGEFLIGAISLNSEEIVAPGIVIATGAQQHLEEELQSFLLAAEED